MNPFTENQRKNDFAYRDRKEYLSQLVIYSDVMLLERLNAFMPLGAAQEEKKALLIKWLKAKIPEDIPSKEAMENEITSRTEMSNAAGRDIGISTMLYHVRENDETDDDTRLINFLVGDIDAKINNIAARALLLSACMRIDTRYGELAGLICGRDDTFGAPTLGELISVCGEEAEGRLQSELARCSNILSIFFLSAAHAENRLSSKAECDDRLLGSILGNEGFLPVWIGHYDEEEVPEAIKFRDKIVDRLVSGCGDKGRITVLSGDSGAGKKTLVRRTSYEIGKPLIICNIGDGLMQTVVSEDQEQAEKTYTADYEEIYKRLLYARRECVIRGAVLLIDGLVEGCEKIVGQVAGFVSGQITDYVPQVFISYNSDKEPTVPPFVRPEVIEPLTNRQRIELWKDFLDPALDVDKENVEETGATFEFTPGQIREAADRLASYGVKKPDRKLMHKACYGVLKGKLSTKAILVDSGFTWDDVKIYPKEKAIMRDICNAVVNRPMVMQDWNFKTKLPYGAGITVLFAGPPGTGKTMSATVIANELGMELYKVDSSRLIDKYVGETEKNIRAIFNAAARSNAILFFDEADAIFNKRMDAKDANERFANIESSLLLQCIEEYNGVVILATNKMSAMDPAFMRRFRFYIQFSEPDEEMAYSIWTSVFPKEAPLAEEIDFRELAHVFKITGAVIKNIALQAAYMAAGSGEEINMVHILRAARREMEKNHKVITREELGRLSFLYQDMMKDTEDPVSDE